MRWIIGDIHGMLRCLAPLVAEVRRVDPGSRLIFTGDYVNRGPQSRGVIDFLLPLQNVHFVRGNHDDIFDLVVNGECYAENAANDNRVAAFMWFMKYGLDTTLMSYDCEDALLDSLADECTTALLDRLASCVPEAHREFIRTLPPLYEDDDLFVVHGKWDPDEPAESPGLTERMARQPIRRHQLLWGRYSEDELPRLKAWRRTGHFGHTPVSHYGQTQRRGTGINDRIMLPVAGVKMVLLDTAAALGVDGRLTAYCPDNGAIIQTDHFGKLLV